MQLQQRDITNLRAGILQSQKFSVEMNGVLFRTTIDGIYSDKKRGYCHVNRKFAGQRTIAVTVHAATVARRHVSIA